MSSTVRFYDAKKMSSISVNARMKKAAESLGGIIFSSVAVVKKTSFGGEQCKMHCETFIIKI